jgi:hypothetical protein
LPQTFGQAVSLHLAEAQILILNQSNESQQQKNIQGPKDIGGKDLNQHHDWA